MSLKPVATALLLVACSSAPSATETPTLEPTQPLPTTAATPTALTATPSAPPSAGPTDSPKPAPTNGPTVAPTASASPTPQPSATVNPSGWLGPEHVFTGRYGELSMMIDADGVAHAAVEKGRRIAYLTNSGAGWVEEFVTPSGTREDYFVTGYARPSIRQLDNGQLRVDFVHYEAVVEGIGYDEEPQFVTGRLGQWSDPAAPTPDEVGPVGQYDSVVRVIDDAGNIHLAHHETGFDGGDLIDCGLVESTSLRYSTNVSGHWTTEDVASGGWSVMAIGSDGRARILILEDHGCAHELTGERIDGMRYAVATTPTGGFEIEFLPPLVEADLAYNARLFLDDSDVPHLIMQKEIWLGDDSYQFDLYHQTRGVDGWTEPELILPGLKLQASSSSGGVVHLFLTGDRGTAWYAAEGGREFETSAVPIWPSAPAAAQSATMTVDDLGRPHLLVKAGDGADAELYYAVGPAD